MKRKPKAKPKAERKATCCTIVCSHPLPQIGALSA